MASASFSGYINGNSILHRMNPIVKIIINILFIVLVFFANSLIYLGIILSISFVFFFTTNLKKRKLYSIFKTTLFISLFLFIVNMFLLHNGYGKTSSGRVDYKNTTTGTGFFFDDLSYWKFYLNDRVVMQTIFIGIRIYIMILLTTLLTSTTKPTALTKSIEDLLFPLKLFFIPVNIIAMIISIALRFIPTLLGEAQRIMKAQASRGVDFKNGNIKSKAKSFVTLIIPLFVSAFSKAEDLGNAMETRGYDPYQKRTRYRHYPIKWGDIVFVLFVFGFAGVIFATWGGAFDLPVWWV